MKLGNKKQTRKKKIKNQNKCKKSVTIFENIYCLSLELKTAELYEPLI